ncbi:MAG: hypothetical protein HOQ28_20065 [Thermoleophilia bacterium]|nr:hypothetical protein [Thermoleophilia bacterium]
MNSSAEIIYGEAIRALEQQEANLDGLRLRTGTLLAAVSLITAFLGPQAIGRHDGTLDWTGWTAVAFFLGSALGGLVILWPWTWSFVVSPTTLIEDHLEVEQPASADDLAVYLSLIHDENWNTNETRLEGLFWAFRAATLCLAAEVVAWLISLTLA